MHYNTEASGVLDLVKMFGERLKKRKEVVEVWLFGSWAYGNPASESDIDIGLVCNGEIGLASELDYFREGQDFDSRIEVVTFEKRRFELARHSLIKEIKEKGIRIA